MSVPNCTSQTSVSEANKDKTHLKKVELAELFYGSVSKRCLDYLTAVEENKEKASLLMVERSLLLCKNRLEKLQRERENRFYGKFSNDDRIVLLENDLHSLVNTLHEKRLILIDEGHVNSLIKFLPEKNRFSNLH